MHKNVTIKLCALFIHNAYVHLFDGRLFMSKNSIKACLMAVVAVATMHPQDGSVLNSSIQSGANCLKSAASWLTATAGNIASDAVTTLTEPAKNLALSTLDFAVKHPGFAALSLGALGYYTYSSWKTSVQNQEEKRKNAADLLELCLGQMNEKQASSVINKTHTACLKTAARDIIDYYDWKTINPLSWSEAVIFYNNRFRVVYTAKELIKDIENNATKAQIAATTQNLLLSFKQLSA